MNNKKDMSPLLEACNDDDVPALQDMPLQITVANHAPMLFAFNQALYLGNFNVVKHVVARQEPGELAQTFINDLFMTACKMGYIDVVKYCLESEEVKVRPIMSTKNGLVQDYGCYMNACIFSRFDVFYYLHQHLKDTGLEAQQLIELASHGLGEALKSQCDLIVQYLLHEEKLPSSPYLQELGKTHEDFGKMLNARDLQEILPVRNEGVRKSKL